MKKLIGVLILTSLLLITACGGPSSSPEVQELTSCLINEGAKMYGAYWCPHCADQKAKFGADFKSALYIECSLPNRQGQTAACQQAGIKSYPTWEFAGGERVEEVLSLKQLAERTGCSYGG